jgi:stage V sporulation protein K
MANAMYTGDEICAMGQKYYHSLAKICKRLEKQGYWREAENMMKQSAAEVLDLYVQSVLVELAVRLDNISDGQKEYIRCLTQTNPLEISPDAEILEQSVVHYAEKYAAMPPILIQICGVYDRHLKEEQAVLFLDNVINVLLCMMELSDRFDRAGQEYIREYYERTVLFVCSGGVSPEWEESYIRHKLAARNICSGVKWLTGEESKKTEWQVNMPADKTDQRMLPETVTSDEVESEENIQESPEDEQREARKEFEKVKKRLQERQKAEKEAKEQRVAKLLDELNQLVGLDNVKEEVRSLVNLIKVRRMREEYKLPAMDMSYHMVFTGNPGTGKTTVARLVARIYRELGILSEGQLIETDRSRLVAGYVGQTAINVREVVEQAIGGVLFIDEAYALVSPDTTNDYGSEAVDTLVKMMEDHRDDLVVIVAGYREEMEQFLRSNTGLISRFNKFITFEDYSEQQLLEILTVMAEQAGMVVEDTAVKKLGLYLASMNEQERRDFGNARGVRNVFERMIVNQANRIVLLEEPTKEQLITLTAQDV